MITEDFIRAIPKTDLHVHLDGSPRIGTLIELAKERGVELPAYDEDGLREKVFKNGYADLNEYLHGFMYTCAVLQDPEALERVAYEFAWDNIDEGVRYVEVRFAPMLHINEKQDIEDVLMAVDRGMRRAKREFNDRLLERDDDSPPFEYGIITCAMRMFTDSFSPYYRKITEAHRYMPNNKLYGLASLELARGVVAVRNKHGLPIVGFDLAGAEHGHPAVDHREAFDYVHRHFMQKTVHAGEAYGAESIFQAITELNADRIGHGYHLLDPAFVSPRVKDPESYVKNLAQFIAESRKTMEICLSSNMDTDPELTSLADHPFRRMWEMRLSATICTDNRLVSRTSVTRELKLAIDHFGLGLHDLKKLVIYGFKRSFYPRDYRQKRIYVRRVMDYFDRVAREHGFEPNPE